MRSITRSITVAEAPHTFVPPFCLNPNCRYHSEPAAGRSAPPWFYRHGRYHTAAFSFVPRFRCRHCGRGCSRQSFRLDYYAKRILDYRELLRQLVSCGSTRDMARATASTTSTVANRIERLARGAAALHAGVLQRVGVAEPLVIDGFQNFAVSKYYPNNINLLVGQHSGLLYDCDYRTIRRSGRMSERQKRRREQLEEHFRAPSNALVEGFRTLVDSAMRVRSHLHHCPEGESSVRGAPADTSEAIKALLLLTDEKNEYKRALFGDTHYRLLTASRMIRHERTLSTEARTAENPLFVVNYFDRQLRKDLKECVRHTVCFGRNVSNVMQRMLLYRLYHNHYKAYRHRRPHERHEIRAGVDGAWIDVELERLYERRPFLSRTPPIETDRLVWLRQLVTPLGRDREYLPKFALA
ncbi:MAG: hypothetical protein EA403_16785 [Spirochaetaceae bacterium]|nr:MAG: hypothetical protein EA403_16785 [Spirochaetaceae bacterium]